jgi:uncharacterized protein (TIGR00255 family)
MPFSIFFLFLMYKVTFFKDNTLILQKKIEGMIFSMTGYGRAETDFHNKKISVEIKSLNSKQFDINLRIPSIYRDKEIEIRSKLLQVIERGKVDFTILVDSSDKPLINKINRSAIDSYYQEIKELAQTLKINEPVDWFSILMRLPETIKTEANELDEKEWTIVCQTIDEALKSFVQFRNQEGEMLEKVFIEKIQNISLLSKEIEQYETERIEKIKIRIQELFRKMEFTYDENRFEQEMIYHIDRLDIHEEKMRLGNHLKYFSETMAGEKNQGRKLGFIVQEIGREINTLGSKSNHAAMQKIVVQMKDELEQVKEQILNVL